MATIESLQRLTNQIESNANRATSASNALFSAVVSAAQNAVAAIDTTLDSIQSAVNAWKTGALKLAGAFLSGGLLGNIGRINNAFSSGLSRSMGGSGGGLLASITGGLSDMLGSVFKPLSGLNNGLLSGPLGLITGAIRSLFTSTITGITTIGGIALNAARAGGSAVMGAVSGVFNGIVNMVTSAANAIWNGIMSVLNSLWETAKTSFTTIFRAALAGGESVGSAALSGVQAAVRGVFTVIQNGMSVVSSALTKFWPALIVVGTLLVNAVAGAVAIGAKALSNGLLFALKAGSFAFNSILLPLFGAIKQTFQAGQNIYGVVAPIIRDTVSTIGGWIRDGFKWFQGAVQGLAGWLRDVIPTIAQAISGFVSKVVAYAPTFVSSLVSVISRVWSFGVALGTLVASIGAAALIVKALWESSKTALELNKTAMQMSATSGMGSGDAFGLIRRLGAFGVSPQATQGAFGGNSALQSMKAGIFGLPDVTSSGFLNSFAEKYGRGMAGSFTSQLMATNMAKVLGLDNPEILALSKLTGAQRARQESYTSGINQSLGLNPSTISAQATEVNLALQRISSGFESLKLKLFSIGAPVLEKGLSAIANLIGANSGKISGFMESAIKWLVVDFPVIFAGAINTVATGVNDAVLAIIGAGKFLASNVPTWFMAIGEFIVNFLTWTGDSINGVSQWLSTAFAAMSNMAAAWAQGVLQYGPVVINGIANGISALSTLIAEWMRSLGNFVTSFATNSQNGLHLALDNITRGIDLFINGLAGSVPVLAGIAASISSAIQQGLLSAPLLGWVIRGIMNNLGLSTTNTLPGTAYKNAYAQAAAQLPATSNLNGSYNSWRNSNQGAMIQMGQTLGQNASTMYYGGQNLANSVRSGGMAGVTGLNALLNQASGGLGSASGSVSQFGANAQGAFAGWAKVIQPLGKEWGKVAGKTFSSFADFTEKNVKPYTGSAAEWAQGAKKDVGTSEEREGVYQQLLQEQRLANQIAAQIRDQMKSGQPMSGVLGDGFETLLAQTMVKAVRSVL